MVNIKGNKILDRILGALLIIFTLGFFLQGIWMNIFLIGLGIYLVIRRTN